MAIIHIQFLFSKITADASQRFVPRESKYSRFILPLGLIKYHLLSTKEAYNESVFHRCDEETIKCAQYRIRRQAQSGFKVIPVQNG